MMAASTLLDFDWLFEEKEDEGTILLGMTVTLTNIDRRAGSITKER
jgi:hypothetical protein